MMIKLGQVSMSIQAIVTEIYYISNHRNFISNHWTWLYILSILFHRARNPDEFDDPDEFDISDDEDSDVENDE